MKKLLGFVVVGVFVIGITAFAQDNTTQKTKSEAFPSTTFAIGFEKLSSGNPLFSWRADMDADFVGYRKGPHNLTGKVRFLTVGARPSHGKVNIAGVAYGLEGCYKYFRTEKNWFSVCNSHLSSHKAEELSGLAREEKERGRRFSTISTVDFNVISFSTGFALNMPIEPEFTFRFQLMSFNYGGGIEFYPQPLYLTSHFFLARVKFMELSFATKHELGASSFNDFYLNLDLFRHGQKKGRAQIYIGYSPNHQVQPSINEMVRRGGFKTGVRLIWDAN